VFCLVGLLAPAAALAQTLPPATDVASQINAGWNVGNSLESTGGETGFGNPLVTQQLIDTAKASGFNAVRIPCAWDGHANQTTLEIDPVWMARVKQVVDYAIGNGMYVVLNIHWDGGWLQDHPVFSFQTAVNQKQRAYWTQIATTFKTYDQHLLFAGTNEVHADFGTPTTENITVQQSYNQTFVDAVRATGGNNASRTLVVQTYNTNMQHGLNFFSLPTDSIANRLIVETHYYDPFDFTLNLSGSCLFWGAPFPTQSACTWAYESYVTDLFAQVRAKWVDQGIPVIIGEYGVATRPNLSLDARQYWLETINHTAASNGLKTFYWDNGVLPSQTNGFALFDRHTGAVTDQGALDAILRGAGVGNPNAQYTLTISTNGSGAVTRNPTATTYAGGTVVTLTATPAAGFDFAGWTGALGGVTNPTTIKMLGNTTVVANFIPHGSGGSGTILREFWLNVTGGTTTSLTSSASYPNSPSGSGQLTSLEGPTNFADNYGSRIRGYIHPPISGTYTFWLASDDGGDLFLSTNDDPANATRIAFVDSWTNPREWTKLPSQQSATINLVAGQKYYIEVLHKDAGGGDNVAVAWQGPGIAQTVIPGTYLSPFVPQNGGTTRTLMVTRAGTGSGTVTSSPSGISCGSTCAAAFAGGASVTLTASAASGSSFAGWSGACTGTGTCTVSMTAARSVTATFNTSVTGAPCDNPITFSGNTGNFNTTGPVCYRTSATINGWGCFNFDGRTLIVGGQPSTCGQMPVTRSADGFVYFLATAGAFPWAGMFTW
jgi:aryl-phospho-beta-D-glucosidase BglC (GH1 family)